MRDELLDGYVDAWRKHTAVSDSAEGRKNLETFLSMLSPDIVYEDVPSGHRHEGLEGVTAMCQMVSGLFDMKIDVTSAHRNDDHFAFEFECAATPKQTGDVVTFRAAAIGAFKDGKVSSHRDYYDLSAFAAQG